MSQAAVACVLEQALPLLVHRVQGDIRHQGCTAAH